jgi:hypothetical protein
MRVAENETRRRSATSFTRALLEQFSSQITAIISRYVGQFLQEYAGDRSKWRGKDTAVYLLSSIASTGGTTMVCGALFGRELSHLGLTRIANPLSTARRQ